MFMTTTTRAASNHPNIVTVDNRERTFSSATVGSTHDKTTTTRRPSFDLPKVREEVFQRWLMEEAKKQQQQSATKGSSSSLRSGGTARYCTVTYYDTRRLYEDPKATWHWLDQELSSNLAGETGAVYIYKGALAAMNVCETIQLRQFTTEAREFAKEHMATEASHLALFESILPPNTGKRTKLLPIWKLAGWTLGFVPTVVAGSKGLYVTVEAVETFVEEHFQHQIQPLSKAATTTPELLRVLQHCCEDEVHHKHDAAAKLLGEVGKEGDSEVVVVKRLWWANPWSYVVKTGSAIAADIARRI